MHYFGPPFTRSFSFWPYGFTHAVTMVLFWLLIAFLIAGLLKWLRTDDQDKKYTDKADNSLNILKERYAKGEITKKEFEEMKKVIS